VAALLDLDESQVRRLVDTGQLEAHRIGRRGIRIFQDSITRYQEMQAIVPPKALAAKRRDKKQRSLRYLHAVEGLKQKGLL
jgi:excisionase family DNA binding protein